MTRPETSLEALQRDLLTALRWEPSAAARHQMTGRVARLGAPEGAKRRGWTWPRGRVLLLAGAALLLMGAASAATLLQQAVNLDPRWQAAYDHAERGEPDPDDRWLHRDHRARLRRLRQPGPGSVARRPGQHLPRAASGRSHRFDRPSVCRGGELVRWRLRVRGCWHHLGLRGSGGCCQPVAAHRDRSTGHERAGLRPALSARLVQQLAGTGGARWARRPVDLPPRGATPATLRGAARGRGLLERARAMALRTCSTHPPQPVVACCVNVKSTTRDSVLLLA